MSYSLFMCKEFYMEDISDSTYTIMVNGNPRTKTNGNSCYHILNLI